MDGPRNIKRLKYFLSREGWPMSRVKYWGHYWCLLTQCFLYLQLLKKKCSCVFEKIYFPFNASSQSSSIKTCFPQSESENLTHRGTQTPDRPSPVFPDTEMEIIKCLILYIRIRVTERRGRVALCWAIFYWQWLNFRFLTSADFRTLSVHCIAMLAFHHLRKNLAL